MWQPNAQARLRPQYDRRGVAATTTWPSGAAPCMMHSPGSSGERRLRAGRRGREAASVGDRRARPRGRQRGARSPPPRPGTAGSYRRPGRGPAPASARPSPPRPPPALEVRVPERTPARVAGIPAWTCRRPRSTCTCTPTAGGCACHTPHTARGRRVGATAPGGDAARPRRPRRVVRHHAPRSRSGKCSAGRVYLHRAKRAKRAPHAPTRRP
jgi:hypothetical protein